MRERMCTDFSSISSLDLRMPDNGGGLSPSLASFKSLRAKPALLTAHHVQFGHWPLHMAQAL